jgi:transglutaminase-like putative cysteine protease
MTASRGLCEKRINWTLFGIGLALLPHLPRLPMWISVFLVTVILWRWQAERHGWSLPPRILRFLIAVAGFAGVVLTYHTINGLNAGTALLAIMMGMKLLETRGQRDQMLLLFIANFLVLAGLLFDQTPWTGAYLLVSVWMITAGLLAVSKAGDVLPLQQTLRLSGRMLLHAVPLMLVMFLFFPRISGPFWSMPVLRAGASSGLSDEMSPGEISDLSLSAEIAFRAQFEGDLPAPRERYWRGPVLSAFDGMRWSVVVPSPQTTTDLIGFSGSEYRYRVTLEPHQKNWIFALDLPASWDRRGITMNRDLQLISRRPIRRLTAYNVVSQTRFTADVSMPQRLARRNLAIPADRNPKTQALARTMLAEAGNADLFISRVLQMFREQEFFYTLQPPRTGFRNGVDDFLFESRQGFCGHYASAFTLMMRAAGIPARVVTGYQGGEYNRLGDYLVVRQADAHAWSEVWLPSRGWQRVDPTAAVAPDRILRGFADTLPFALSAQERFLRLHPALLQMRQAWDAMHNAWNEWILDYDLDRQHSLLEKLGFHKPDWKSLAMVLAAGLVLALFFLGLSTARGFRRRKTHPADKSWQLFCHRLAGKDLARKSDEGPLNFSRRVIESRPDLSAVVTEIADTYIAIRYYPNPGSDRLRLLKDRVAGFRP